MKALLDTHVFVWLAVSPDRVPPSTLAALESAERRMISAASAYEISFKTSLGKLEIGRRVLDEWDRLLRDMLAVELPLSVAHMRYAGELSWDHRDPFDRMLVAQAQCDDLTLVTGDDRIRSFRSAPTVWG